MSVSRPALAALRAQLVAGLGARARVRVPHRASYAVVEIRGSVDAGREGLRADVANAAPGTEVVSIGPGRDSTRHGGVEFVFEVYPQGTFPVPARGGLVAAGIGAGA